MADLFSRSCYGNMELSPRHYSSAERTHLGILKELESLYYHPNNYSDDTRLGVLIRLWTCLKNSIYQTKCIRSAFYKLLRGTGLLILSPHWDSISAEKKHELFSVIDMCGHLLNPFIDHCLKKCSDLRILSTNAWNNPFIPWDKLMVGELPLDDPNVQAYLRTEPEEVVLSRIHFLAVAGCPQQALCLVKYMFRFYSTSCKKHLHPEHVNGTTKHLLMGNCDSRSENAPLKWLMILLRMKKTINEITTEVADLNVHERLHIIMYSREDKDLKPLSDMLISIFVIQEVQEPTGYCCFKELLKLWCLSMKENDLSLQEVTGMTRNVFGKYSPTSVHFFVLTDVLWEQFGPSFLPLYMELFVRAVTTDVNHLEVARTRNMQVEVEELETHLASMFIKFSALFFNGNEVVAREFVLSAFCLRPTEERLHKLKQLTHSLVPYTTSLKEKSQFSKDDLNPSSNSVNGGLLCMKTFHPLLMKGIHNIPYSIVADMVIVLEAVRPSVFQFSLFDWNKAMTELGNYLNSWKRKHALPLTLHGSLVNDVESSLSEEYHAESELIVSAYKSETKEVVWPVTDPISPHFVNHVGANIEVETDSRNALAVDSFDRPQSGVQMSKPSNTPSEEKQKSFIQDICPEAVSSLKEKPATETSCASVLHVKAAHNVSVNSRCDVFMPKHLKSPYSADFEKIACSSASCSVDISNVESVGANTFVGCSSRCVTINSVSTTTAALHEVPPSTHLSSPAQLRVSTVSVNSHAQHSVQTTVQGKAACSHTKHEKQSVDGKSLNSITLNSLEGLGSPQHIIGSQVRKSEKHIRLGLKPKGVPQNFIQYRTVLIKPPPVPPSCMQLSPTASVSGIIVQNSSTPGKVVHQSKPDGLSEGICKARNVLKDSVGETSVHTVATSAGVPHVLLQSPVHNSSHATSASTTVVSSLRPVPLLATPPVQRLHSPSLEQKSNLKAESAPDRSSVICHTMQVQASSVAASDSQVSSQRIPVSINQMSKMSLPNKEFLPAIKISLPPEIKTIGNRMLSANLVIPCSSSHGQGSGQSLTEKAPAATASNTITIPGVVVVKKRPAPAIERTAAKVQNITKPAWTTLRSLHGNVHCKRMRTSNAENNQTSVLCKMPSMLDTSAPDTLSSSSPQPGLLPDKPSTLVATGAAAADLKSTTVGQSVPTVGLQRENSSFASPKNKVSNLDSVEAAVACSHKTDLSQQELLSDSISSPKYLGSQNYVSAHSVLSTKCVCGSSDVGSTVQHTAGAGSPSAPDTRKLPTSITEVIAPLSASSSSASRTDSKYTDTTSSLVQHTDALKAHIQHFDSLEVASTSSSCKAEGGSFGSSKDQDKVSALPSNIRASTVPCVTSSHVQVSPSVNTEMCCSPFELNPCQNCSSLKFRTASEEEERVPSSEPSFVAVHKEACIQTHKVIKPCETSALSSDEGRKLKKAPTHKCTFCGKMLGTPYTLKMHIIKFHTGPPRGKKKTNSEPSGAVLHNVHSSAATAAYSEKIVTCSQVSPTSQDVKEPQVCGADGIKTEIKQTGGLGNKEYFTRFIDLDNSTLHNHSKFSVEGARSSASCAASAMSHISQPLKSETDGTSISHTNSKTSVCDKETEMGFSKSREEDSKMFQSGELQSSWQIAGTAIHYLNNPTCVDDDDDVFHDFQATSSLASFTEAESSFHSNHLDGADASYDSSYPSPLVHDSNSKFRDDKSCNVDKMGSSEMLRSLLASDKSLISQSVQDTGRGTYQQTEKPPDIDTALPLSSSSGLQPSFTSISSSSQPGCLPGKQSMVALSAVGNVAESQTNLVNMLKSVSKEEINESSKYSENICELAEAVASGSGDKTSFTQGCGESIKQSPPSSHTKGSEQASCSPSFEGSKAVVPHNSPSKRPTICHVCTKVLCSLGSLKRHMRNVHKVVDFTVSALKQEHRTLNVSETSSLSSDSEMQELSLGSSSTPNRFIEPLSPPPVLSPQVALLTATADGRITPVTLRAHSATSSSVQDETNREDSDASSEHVSNSHEKLSDIHMFSSSTSSGGASLQSVTLQSSQSSGRKNTPVSCHICNKMFSSIASRKRHLKNIHKSSVDETECKKKEEDEECTRKKVQSIIERITIETQKLNEEKRAQSLACKRTVQTSGVAAVTAVATHQSSNAPRPFFATCSSSALNQASNGPVDERCVKNTVSAVALPLPGAIRFSAGGHEMPSEISTLNSVLALCLQSVASVTAVTSSHHASVLPSSTAAATGCNAGSLTSSTSQSLETVNSCVSSAGSNFTPFESTVDNFQSLFDDNLISENQEFIPNATVTDGLKMAKTSQYMGLDTLVMQYLNESDETESSVKGIGIKGVSCTATDELHTSVGKPASCSASGLRSADATLEPQENKEAFTVSPHVGTLASGLQQNNTEQWKCSESSTVVCTSASSDMSALHVSLPVSKLSSDQCSLTGANTGALNCTAAKPCHYSISEILNQQKTSACETVCLNQSDSNAGSVTESGYSSSADNRIGFSDYLSTPPIPATTVATAPGCYQRLQSVPTSQVSTEFMLQNLHTTNSNNQACEVSTSIFSTSLPSFPHLGSSQHATSFVHLPFRAITKENASSVESKNGDITSPTDGMVPSQSFCSIQPHVPDYAVSARGFSHTGSNHQQITSVPKLLDSELKSAAVAHYAAVTEPVPILVSVENKSPTELTASYAKPPTLVLSSLSAKGQHCATPVFSVSDAVKLKTSVTAPLSSISTNLSNNSSEEASHTLPVSNGDGRYSLLSLNACQNSPVSSSVYDKIPATEVDSDGIVLPVHEVGDETPTSSCSQSIYRSPISLHMSQFSTPVSSESDVSTSSSALSELPGVGLSVSSAEDNMVRASTALEPSRNNKASLFTSVQNGERLLLPVPDVNMKPLTDVQKPHSHVPALNSTQDKSPSRIGTVSTSARDIKKPTVCANTSHVEQALSSRSVASKSSLPASFSNVSGLSSLSPPSSSPPQPAVCISQHSSSTGKILTSENSSSVSKGLKTSAVTDSTCTPKTPSAAAQKVAKSSCHSAHSSTSEKSLAPKAASHNSSLEKRDTKSFGMQRLQKKVFKKPQVKLVRLDPKTMEAKSAAALVLSKLENKQAVSFTVFNANNKSSLCHQDAFSVSKILSCVKQQGSAQLKGGSIGGSVVVCDAKVTPSAAEGPKQSFSVCDKTTHGTLLESAGNTEQSSKISGEKVGLQTHKTQKQVLLDSSGGVKSVVSAVDGATQKETMNYNKNKVKEEPGMGLKKEIQAKKFRSKSHAGQKAEETSKTQIKSEKQPELKPREKDLRNSSGEVCSQDSLPSSNCPKLVLKKVEVKQPGEKSVQYYVPASKLFETQSTFSEHEEVKQSDESSERLKSEICTNGNEVACDEYNSQGSAKEMGKAPESNLVTHKRRKKVKVEQEQGTSSEQKVVIGKVPVNNAYNLYHVVKKRQGFSKVVKASKGYKICSPLKLRKAKSIESDVKQTFEASLPQKGIGCTKSATEKVLVHDKVVDSAEGKQRSSRPHRSVKTRSSEQSDVYQTRSCVVKLNKVKLSNVGSVQKPKVAHEKMTETSVTNKTPQVSGKKSRMGDGAAKSNCNQLSSSRHKLNSCEVLLKKLPSSTEKPGRRSEKVSEEIELSEESVENSEAEKKSLRPRRKGLSSRYWTLRALSRTSVSAPICITLDSD